MEVDLHYLHCLRLKWRQRWILGSTNWKIWNTKRRKRGKLFVQTIQNVRIPGQLRMDSPLRRGRESSRSGTGIWALCFPTQICPDGVSEHTLQSLSQTLRRMKTFEEREREIESGSENLQCPQMFSFFLMFDLGFGDCVWTTR